MGTRLYFAPGDPPADFYPAAETIGSDLIFIVTHVSPIRPGRLSRKSVITNITPLPNMTLRSFSLFLARCRPRLLMERSRARSRPGKAMLVPIFVSPWSSRSSPLWALPGASFSHISLKRSQPSLPSFRQTVTALRLPRLSRSLRLRKATGLLLKSAFVLLTYQQVHYMRTSRLATMPPQICQKMKPNSNT